LVGIGFTARGKARANYTDAVYAMVRVSDKEKPLLRRCANRNEPTLVSRVIRIIERFSEGIQKYRCGLIK
jgi:hypothetical protein